MAALLSRLLRAMGRHAQASVRAGRSVNFEAYRRVIYETLLPLYLAEYGAGAREALQAIGLKGWRRKAPQLGEPALDFHLLREEVPLAVQNLALALAGSVTDSTREAVRQALDHGLQDGASVNEIADAIGSHFEPRRAWLIAQTEASRALHTGELDAAREAGVKGKSWLVSSDACDACKKCASLGIIPLSKPFHVDHKGGPYAVVMTAPRHPGCFCSVLLHTKLE